MSALGHTTHEERSRNALRPKRLADVVGQARAKALISAAIESCIERVAVLDHMLLVGAAGTGKSTLAHVIGGEFGVDVFQVEAPVSSDTLMMLRDEMQKGDILLIDEIHQQAIMERRGRQTSTQPEVLFSVMEDQTIVTEHGPMWFPKICVIGATTDEGMLPDAFISRFPLKPRLEAYTLEDLRTIVLHNARALDLRITKMALDILARASRGIPREINNLVRNARLLTRAGALLDYHGARNVLDVCSLEADGLTADMAELLRFLYTRAQRRKGNGEVVYQASVNTIATAIGKSRDTKAVALRVEPYLIQAGYVQVLHGGRALTDAGVVRAKELLSA